jgi:hypothetical protein
MNGNNHLAEDLERMLKDLSLTGITTFTRECDQDVIRMNGQVVSVLAAGLWDQL